MIKLELNKEEVEALKHMLKVEIKSYKTDEIETPEFNTLIQLAKKVSNAKRKATWEAKGLERAMRVGEKLLALDYEWE